MPRLASGLTTRARRPRPSEKTTSASSPGFPPVGHLALVRPSPRRGGLRTQAKRDLSLTDQLLPSQKALGPAPPLRAVKCRGARRPLRKRTEGMPRGNGPKAPLQGFQDRLLDFIRPLGETPRKTHLTYIIHEQKFGRPVLWAPLDRGELQWVEDKVSLWTFWRLALW
jgi:hypothetical protein